MPTAPGISSLMSCSLNWSINEIASCMGTKQCTYIYIWSKYINISIYFQKLCKIAEVYCIDSVIQLSPHGLNSWFVQPSFHPELESIQYHPYPSGYPFRSCKIWLFNWTSSFYNPEQVLWLLSKCKNNQLGGLKALPWLWLAAFHDHVITNYYSFVRLTDWDSYQLNFMSVLSHVRSSGDKKRFSREWSGL